MQKEESLKYILGFNILIILFMRKSFVIKAKIASLNQNPCQIKALREVTKFITID